MTDLSSHFVLIDPELIRADLPLRRITFIPAGAERFACTGKISFEQTPSEDDRGTVWTLNFRAVTLDSSVRNYDGREMYVGLVMTDGTIRVIGTASEVPRVRVTPYAAASEVACSFESASPVDL